MVHSLQFCDPNFAPPEKFFPLYLSPRRGSVFVSRGGGTDLIIVPKLVQRLNADDWRVGLEKYRNSSLKQDRVTLGVDVADTRVVVPLKFKS